MKKKFLVTALMFSLVASLAGCGQKKAKVSLCEYKGIALQSVTDDEVEEKIETYVTNYFTDDVEIDGPAEDGDTVNINYVGTLNGVAFDGGTCDDEAGYDLTLGSDTFIDGFEDGLIGTVKGQNIDLNLTFPENYSESNTELNGADVVFNVTINKITRPVAVELTDESVKERLEYETVDEFYAGVRESLNRTTYENQIAEYLADNCTVKNIPEDEITEYSDSIYSYVTSYMSYYSSMSGMSESAILYYMLGLESTDALKEYCLTGATETITYQYIIREIAEKEGITPSEDEYAVRSEEYAEYYGYDSVSDLIESVGEDALNESIISDLTIDFLIENAEIF